MIQIVFQFAERFVTIKFQTQVEAVKSKHFLHLCCNVDEYIMQAN